jgi:aminopeptidase
MIGIDMDPRLARMAGALISYCVGVQPDDWTVIHVPVLGLPLAIACVDATLAAGGHPTLNVTVEEVQETILQHASDAQLRFISPIRRAMVEGEVCEIGIRAPTNTRALTGVDPARLALQSESWASLNKVYMERVGRGDLRWVATMYPTDAAAQDAGMSLRDYREFVFGACLLDETDPVAAWQRLGERQQRLVDWLDGSEEIRITGPDTDLSVSVAGRTWLNDDGHKNFPGGEVFTSPVEDSAQGHVRFNFPALYGGREVTGVRLAFEQGRVTDASADMDETYLHEMLRLEGAGRLGELAFGTNPGIQRFTRNILFDEKISGTMHMALGNSITEAGGTNISTLHWDMVLDLRRGSEVHVDGRLLLKDGVFQI